MENKKTYMMMTFAALCWAGAFIAGKIAMAELPVFTVAFFRFLIATTIIFPIMIMREPDWKVGKESLPRLLTLGLVGMFGYHALFFTSLKYTTAVSSSMIGATNPLMTSALAAIFLNEAFGIKRMGVLLLAFSGVLLSISGGSVQTIMDFSFNKGDLIMLAAVVCWAAYSILSKRAAKFHKPIVLISYSFLFCTIMLVPFALMEKPWLILGSTSMGAWIAIVYMAIFASCIGYFIQQVAIRRIGPSKTNIFINLVPVFSMGLAAPILHETIGWYNILGMFMIIAGVYTNSTIKEKKIARPEELVS
jgi:drug/metabolite transporter (DMT)-like permease